MWLWGINGVKQRESDTRRRQKISSWFEQLGLLNLHITSSWTDTWHGVTTEGFVHIHSQRGGTLKATRTCFSASMRVRDVVWKCERAVASSPGLRCLEVCLLQRGSDAFENELSKVTTPDSARRCTFPFSVTHKPRPTISCGYLLWRGASEKMRSGRGGRRERRTKIKKNSSNIRPLEAWEATAIILSELHVAVLAD